MCSGGAHLLRLRRAVRHRMRAGQFLHVGQRDGVLRVGLHVRGVRAVFSGRLNRAGRVAVLLRSPRLRRRVRLVRPKRQLRGERREQRGGLVHRQRLPLRLPPAALCPPACSAGHAQPSLPSSAPPGAAAGPAAPRAAAAGASGAARALSPARVRLSRAQRQLRGNPAAVLRAAGVLPAGGVPAVPRVRVEPARLCLRCSRRLFLSSRFRASGAPHRRHLPRRGAAVGRGGRPLLRLRCAVHRPQIRRARRASAKATRQGRAEAHDQPPAHRRVCHGGAHEWAVRDQSAVNSGPMRSFDLLCTRHQAGQHTAWCMRHVTVLSAVG